MSAWREQRHGSGGGRSLRRDPQKPSGEMEGDDLGIFFFPGAKLDTHAANPRNNGGRCFSGG